MFAQINHVALISHQYNTLGKFYEAVFGLKSSAKGRPASAITIGDGYVGLNLIPRRDGYVEGIDHFGMVVDDARRPALVDSGVRGHVGQAPGSGPYRLSCRESGRVQGAGRGSGRDESLSRRRAARWQPGIGCAQTLFRGSGGRQMADVRSRRELDRHYRLRI